MALCVYCKAETELFDSGTPICIECSEEARDAKRKPQATQSQIRTTLDESLANSPCQNPDFRPDRNVGGFQRCLPERSGVSGGVS
jgi:hypothetical protein